MASCICHVRNSALWPVCALRVCHVLQCLWLHRLWCWSLLLQVPILRQTGHLAADSVGCGRAYRQTQSTHGGHVGSVVVAHASGNAVRLEPWLSQAPLPVAVTLQQYIVVVDHCHILAVGWCDIVIPQGRFTHRYHGSRHDGRSSAPLRVWLPQAVWGVDAMPQYGLSVSL